MAHYYAFCEVHKKCGPNRNTENEAWNDVDYHVNNVLGPHGQVFVKLSNSWRDTETGRKKFRYRFFKTR